MKFGQAVAADGNLLAVSAVRRNLDGSGVVLVYDRSQAWQLVQTLSPKRPAVADHFGYSLALRGRHLVVGSPGASGRAEADGNVQIYERRGGWQPLAELHSSDPSFQGRFGDAVAFDGKRVVVGAPLERFTAGAAYIFDAGSWALTARLTASQPEGEDEFGRSVAVLGDRVAVGAPRSVFSDRPRPGFVHVFECRSRCRQTHRLETPEHALEDQFGASVALSDSIVLVGAPLDSGVGDLTGAVHVFDASMWRTAILRASSMSERDLFGGAMISSGEMVVVGARTAAFTSGAVYLYPWSEIRRSPALSFRLVAHPRSGLSSRTVDAIVQDSQGFLWIGTPQGLNRFDGSEFRRYRREPNDSTSLSNNAVLSLLEDREGRLWVGTENGLNLYDRENDRFHRLVLPSDSIYPRQSIRILFEDRKGRLWTGTNGRLFLLRNGRFEDTGAPGRSPFDLDETYISGIQQDASGRIWVLSKSLWELRASLYEYDPETGDVVRHAVPRTWGQVGPLLIDSRNKLWMKAPTPVSLPLTAEVRPAVLPLQEPHWALLEARDGTVWAGTAAGLFRSRIDETERYQVMPNRVSANFIRSLYQSRDGRIFVGTQDGLYVVEDPSTPVESAGIPLVLTDVRVAGRAVSPSTVSSLRLSHSDNHLAIKYAAPVFGRTRPLRLVHRLSEIDADFIEGPASYASLQPGSYTFEVRAMDDTLVAASLVLPVRVLPPFWQTWWFRFLVLAAIGGVLAMLHQMRVTRLLELERLRTRIAGDLHDDVSSNLSGIAFVTELVRRRPELGTSERTQLAQVASTARETIEDLRDIIWFIDPSRDRLESLLSRMRDASSLILNGTEVDLRL
ncbi:MAG: two-component regulator propeller domain-containing protein, partial [Rhodothermales bacterium]